MNYLNVQTVSESSFEIDTSTSTVTSMSEVSY